MNKTQVVEEIKCFINEEMVCESEFVATLSTLEIGNKKASNSYNNLDGMVNQYSLTVLNAIYTALKNYAWENTEEESEEEEAPATEVFENNEVAATEESETPTFTQILTHVQENLTDLQVVTIGGNYFNVENAEGYRAYFEIPTYGYNYENPNYYKGFNFSTCHKPNKNTGTGWRHIELRYNATMDEIVTALYETLEKSKKNIVSGKEKMDTRIPHENGKYFI